MTLAEEIARRGLVPNVGMAYRLIRDGGIRVDGGIVIDNIEIDDGQKITLRPVKGCTDLHKTTNYR